MVQTSHATPFRFASPGTAQIVPSERRHLQFGDTWQTRITNCSSSHQSVIYYSLVRGPRVVSLVNRDFINSPHLAFRCQRQVYRLSNVGLILIFCTAGELFLGRRGAVSMRLGSCDSVAGELCLYRWGAVSVTLWSCVCVAGELCLCRWGVVSGPPGSCF